MRSVRQITVWMPVDLAERIDRAIADRASDPLGGRATRHSFVVAAVRKAVEDLDGAVDGAVDGVRR